MAAIGCHCSVGCDDSAPIVEAPTRPDTATADTSPPAPTDISNSPEDNSTEPPTACTSEDDCIGKVLVEPCQRPRCTDSICSVEPAADGTPCTDGGLCFTDKTCDSGECQGGVPIDCEDGDPCTLNSCEETTGCTHVTTAGGCDDGNICTLADYCLDGVCTAGNSVCPCITDADCDQWLDGNQCGGELRCMAGLCKPDPLTIPQCPTEKVTSCTIQGCDPGTGDCTTFPLPNGTICSDSDPCTTGDNCVSGNCIGSPGACSCTSDADCLAYDDGNLCNGRLSCAEGQCVFDASTIVKCSESTNPCAGTSCDPATGSCTSTALDGSICDDTDPCTTGDVCVGSVCAGTPVNCDDLNTCTTDTCDADGMCQHVPNSSICSDNDECTVGDTCIDGVCVPGTDQCSCNTTADCLAFDDGNACNGTLECVSGMCQPATGSLVTCDPSINSDCAVNTCNPQTGQCELTPTNEAAPCFDGDACTQGEFCQSGICGGGLSECNCQAATDYLSCNSFPSKWANFAFGSTQNVDVWPCSPGDFSAKEFAWQVFTNQPVSMTITLSKEDGKTGLFVVEDTGNGCSANDCQKYHPSSVTFIASPEKTQYVVVDAKDGESGEFELDVSCQTAIETFCNNGFDEDNDGQTDCNDPDCETDPWCSGIENCENQLDDDNDGKIDCNDPDCQTNPICSTICVPQTNAYCGLATLWQTGGIGSTDDVDTYSCSVQSFDGPEVVYTFDAQKSQLVTVSLPEFFPGANVMVMQGQQGACNGAYCIATGPTSASFFAIAGTTYYIAVDGQFDTQGGYKIKIDCQ